MASHHVAISPRKDCLIISVAGERSDEAARASNADAIEARRTSGIDRVLFDTCSAILPVKPAALVARALDLGAKLPRSRVAILANAEDDTYARLWRKGLAETGHDAIVFTQICAAEAWLHTSEDAEAVYLP